jgi:prolyl 4-hydroxylase
VRNELQILRAVVVAGRLNTVRGGNRICTVLMYLSDVEEGGGTGFPNVGITVMPKKGRVLVFYNCLPGQPGRPDVKALHAGTPVISGVKWAVNKWCRQRPMKAVRARRAPPLAEEMGSLSLA